MSAGSPLVDQISPIENAEQSQFKPHHCASHPHHLHGHPTPRKSNLLGEGKGGVKIILCHATLVAIYEGISFLPPQEQQP